VRTGLNCNFDKIIYEIIVRLEGCVKQLLYITKIPHFVNYKSSTLSVKIQKRIAGVDESCVIIQSIIIRIGTIRRKELP